MVPWGSIGARKKQCLGSRIPSSSGSVGGGGGVGESASCRESEGAPAAPTPAPGAVLACSGCSVKVQRMVNTAWEMPAPGDRRASRGL